MIGSRQHAEAALPVNNLRQKACMHNRIRDSEHMPNDIGPLRIFLHNIGI